MGELGSVSIEEFLLMEGVHASPSGMQPVNFEAMLEEIDKKIVEANKQLDQTSIVLPIDNETKPRLYSDKEFLEDLIGIMRNYQDMDFFSSMSVLQKIGFMRDDFKFRCSRVFREERYRLAPPLELDNRRNFETDFEFEEEINTFIYAMVSCLVNGISDTHPKKDMDKRKVLLLNLSLSIDSRELKEFYYSLREKEIADYVPSLSTDVKQITLDIFFKLSKDLLAVIREDFAMTSEVIDTEFLVEMFVSLYLNKYTIMLGDICLDVAEGLYNHKQSPILPYIIEIFELALDFQENVSDVINKKKGKPQKEQKLSISVPKQVDFAFGAKSFIFGHENFVSSTLNGITVEIVFILGEVSASLFGKEISFDSFLNTSDHPILKDIRSLIDRLMHIVTVFTVHNLLDFKNNMLKKICYGFSTLLGQFDNFLFKTDFDPRKLKNLYVAYSTLLYCCDSVCYFGSLYIETEHCAEEKTFDFTQMNNFYREKSKTFRDFIIEYHSSIISLYCVPDVRYQMDWDTHRKFLNDDRCSYGIQMWNYYMKCTCKDLFKSVTDYFASDLFSELLYHSAKTWNETYSNIFPTTKKKVLQFRNDVSFLIMYIRSFRGVLDGKFEKSINRECLKMLVYMSILCASFPTIKTFLENIDSKEGNVLNARFVVIYQQAKPVKYIKGIPILVWNSPKFNPMFEFDHLLEYNRVGNGSDGASNEIDFSEVKNISFDYPTLLHGYYVFGLPILTLCNRILLRCEYNDNDYPPPSDEEKVLREDIKGIISMIK